MSAASAARRPIRVLVWGENVHEQVEPHVAAIYPDGMHAMLGSIPAILLLVLAQRYISAGVSSGAVK
jgi:ABC-type maltose transport system permease subunit